MNMNLLAEIFADIFCASEFVKKVKHKIKSESVKKSNVIFMRVAVKIFTFNLLNILLRSTVNSYKLY